MSMVGNKTGFYIGEVFGDIVGLISLLKNFLVGTGAAAGAALTIAGPGGAVVTLGAGAIAVSIAGGISIQCIVNDTLSAGGSLGEDVGDELEEGKKNKGDSEAGDIDLDKKPTANSSKLQNFINSLYKGQGNPNQIGNGTTMDSIRYEVETGNPVEGKFHSQKGQEFMNGINKLINSGSLDAHDETIARAIVEDIANALAGK